MEIRCLQSFSLEIDDNSNAFESKIAFTTIDKLITSRQTPYWMLIASLVSAFVLARVVAQGMFVDGLIYADLSRNLSEGVGDAWRLQFSETLFPVFSEHPPLAIWLQSVAFTTFWDSIYFEKFYSLGLLQQFSGKHADNIRHCCNPFGDHHMRKQIEPEIRFSL